MCAEMNVEMNVEMSAEVSELVELSERAYC
jgi:hypothetical protein